MTYERAIVIGGGMTGILAAKVLSTIFHQVFMIEKDELPDSPKNRLGTPQAFHPHRMLPLGKQIVERLFPGYTKELLTMGGFNTWHQPSRFITKERRQRAKIKIILALCQQSESPLMGLQAVEKISTALFFS